MTNNGQDSAPTQSSPRIGVDLIGLIRDAFIADGQVNNDHSVHGDSTHEDGENLGENLEMDDLDEVLEEDTLEVAQLIQDAEEELYPGCKSFSKLSFLLHLYHLKVLNGWTAKSFTKLLELLLDAFSEGVSLPKSHGAARGLARGPNRVIRRFSGYSIKGLRFHTISREKDQSTQNSGVVNVTEVGQVNYYGKITDIIELKYYGSFRVVLFKCDWVDVHHHLGMQQDEFGFTSVNFSRLIHTGYNLNDDPFIFSSQVDQVFYVDDPLNMGWSVVIRFRPRDTYDMGEDDLEDMILSRPSAFGSLDVEDCPTWVRTDVEEEFIV
ncbi:unnamed protein product [Linum trigynum]|uniref:DUF4216 domain-containing protein n=1 Tax=Linum trigynum TaxID=586398 RepID=A0AAV2FBK8_9ROSI